MNPYRFPFRAMGSPCEILLYGRNLRGTGKVAALAIAEAERLERRYSRYRSDSLLTKINAVAAVAGAIDLDAETVGLFNYVDACFRESNGLFDVTSGVLRRAWRYDDNALPDQAQVDRWLSVVGWQYVHWQPPVLAFTKAGMEVDLGGVVKEYAVDRISTLCQEAGIDSGYVNLGGDLRIIGPRPDGLPWCVGVRHPRKRGQLLQLLKLHEGAVASSGDYERCIEIGGKRYGHILHPKTGWPVQYLAAVSVIGELCLTAGSAATIALLKENSGPAWLHDTGMSYLWVDVTGKIGGPLAQTCAQHSHVDSTTLIG